jgi:hypothetical protein
MRVMSGISPAPPPRAKPRSRVFMFGQHWEDTWAWLAELGGGEGGGGEVGVMTYITHATMRPNPGLHGGCWCVSRHRPMTTRLGLVPQGGAGVMLDITPTNFIYIYKH